MICRSCIAAFYPVEESHLFVGDDVRADVSYACPLCREQEQKWERERGRGGGRCDGGRGWSGSGGGTCLRRDWVEALAEQHARDIENRAKKEAAAAAADARGGLRGNRRSGGAATATATAGALVAVFEENAERDGGRRGRRGAGGGGGRGGTGGRGGAAGRNGSNKSSKMKDTTDDEARRRLDYMENDDLDDNVGPEQWERQLTNFKRQLDEGAFKGGNFEMELDGADLKKDVEDDGTPWIFFEQVCASQRDEIKLRAMQCMYTHLNNLPMAVINSCPQVSLARRLRMYITNIRGHRRWKDVRFDEFAPPTQQGRPKKARTIPELLSRARDRNGGGGGGEVNGGASHRAVDYNPMTTLPWVREAWPSGYMGYVGTKTCQSHKSVRKLNDEAEEVYRAAASSGEEPKLGAKLLSEIRLMLYAPEPTTGKFTTSHPHLGGVDGIRRRSHHRARPLAHEREPKASSAGRFFPGGDRVLLSGAHQAHAGRGKASAGGAHGVVALRRHRRSGGGDASHGYQDAQVRNLRE